MNSIRVYDASYQLEGENVILSGLMSEPIRALVRMPLIGLAREMAEQFISQSHVKNTSYEPPKTVDVITDELNYAFDLEIVEGDSMPPAHSL